MFNSLWVLDVLAFFYQVLAQTQAFIQLVTKNLRKHR